jgi:S-(hydroxymethyl)glutathione dehydrogenase/alcohol dehydrogenase
MPQLVKAAVLYKANSPLRIENGILAPDPAPGQVLVKLAYSGVCRSQLMEVRGHRGIDRFLPHMLGHEGSGVVVATGIGISKLKVNDRVVLGWIKSSGSDVPATKYNLGGQVINAGAVTTFSDYALISENRCVRLPDGMPMDLAVLLGCAIPTGAGIVFNTIQPPAGSSIVVFGLGGVGMSALLACCLANCAQVIAVDVNPAKLATAKKLGATFIINPNDIDPVGQIRLLTGGVGADYAIESAGLVKTIELAFDSIRRGGLCVFASHPPSNEKISLDPHELISGKRILGSWGGDSNPDRDVPRYVELYRTGKLNLGALISTRYSLDKINFALDDLAAQRVTRPLIEIDSTLG